MTFRGSKSAGAAPAATQTTEAKASPVNVEIRGHKLSIRSTHSSDHVQGLATYVDGKVAEIQSAAPSVPLDKLLMLASMTVAEELFEERRKNEELRRQLKKRVDAALAMLDEAAGRE